MSNLPATSSPATPTRQTLDTVEGARSLQQLATIFSGSSLVPKEFQGKTANCVIALDIAARLNLSPMMVFQQLYIVNGKPSWSSAFMISMFNQRATQFERIEYRYAGEPGTPQRTCWARARLKSTGEYVEGPPVTLRMAKTERWGSKWDSMPELMLKYRAAAFFIRTSCPEILFGLYTEEEAMDIEAAEKTKATAKVVARPGEPAPTPVQKLLQAFADWNIPQSAIEEYLGHSVDTISDEEMKRLREVWKEIKRKNGAVVLDIFPSLAGGPADVMDVEPVPVEDNTAATEVVLDTQEEAPAAPEQPVVPQLSKEQQRAKDIEHFYAECKRHKVPSRVMIACYRANVPRASDDDAMAEMGRDPRNFDDILYQVNEQKRQQNAGNARVA